MSAAWWQRVKQVAEAYKVATLPLSIVGTGVAVANLYSNWNPKGYARWYLYSVSAGKFKEPRYKGQWVQNKGMTEIVEQALKPHPDEEMMTLISGLQISGKTSAVLKECHKQGRVGFFVDLGSYKGENTKEKIEAFIAEGLISNDKATDHSCFQKLKWVFLPLPDSKYVWAGLHGVFEKHAKDNLVFVMDETQQVANKAVQHSGVLNELCKVSQFGSVVLIASEFAVARFFKEMTHIARRTTMVYARAATAEEMLPHVQGRFGDDGAKNIVEVFDGSFELLRRLDENRARGIDGVRRWHKEQLENALELTTRGMMDGERATSTGGAMLAAAKLAFGDTPLKAFDKDTLELAQVGGAKIETVGDDLKASWATPLTGEIMKELVCDKAAHAVMKRRVPKDLYAEFEKAVEGRCPTAPAKK